MYLSLRMVIDRLIWNSDPSRREIFIHRIWLIENSINTYWGGLIHRIACLLLVIWEYFQLNREKFYEYAQLHSAYSSNTRVPNKAWRWALTTEGSSPSLVWCSSKKNKWRICIKFRRINMEFWWLLIKFWWGSPPGLVWYSWRENTWRICVKFWSRNNEYQWKSTKIWWKMMYFLRMNNHQNKLSYLH